MPTCYTCQEEITFDKNIRSKTGKQIPLWPDKQNAHGHDEQGNAIKQPLPSQQGQYDDKSWQSWHKPNNQQPSNYSKTPSSSGGFTFKEPLNYTKQQDFKIPTDIPKTSQGGLPLDTKRLLQAVVELTKEFREFREEVKNNVQIDSARYENQMDIIYNRLSRETQEQMFQTAKDIDPVVTNHAKIAEDKQNFMQRRKDRSPQIHDESKEQIPLDDRIPDNRDEFAVAQALKDDDEEGVIDEE